MSFKISLSLLKEFFFFPLLLSDFHGNINRWYIRVILLVHLEQKYIWIIFKRQIIQVALNGAVIRVLNITIGRFFF